MNQPKIYKYVLNDVHRFEVELPMGWEFKSIGMQFGKPVLWASVYPERRTKLYNFRMIHTGDEVPNGYSYLGTLIDADMVYHFYVQYEF